MISPPIDAGKLGSDQDAPRGPNGGMQDALADGIVTVLASGRHKPFLWRHSDSAGALAESLCDQKRFCPLAT